MIMTELHSYFIQTYGCQMNLADSERLSGLLEGLGLSAAATWQDASVVILYSCSVRQAAEDKVFGWGKKIKEYTGLVEGSRELGEDRDDASGSEPQLPTTNPRLPIFVLTGCMAGSARGERKRYTEKQLKQKAKFVDYFLSPDEWEHQLPQILVREGLISPASLGTFIVSAKRKPGNSAFVKISEGCDNFCTYCVVPFGRGAEISRSRGEIMTEVQHLVSQGFRHITLLGQNVNSWGISDAEEKRNIRINSETALPFASLLRDVHSIKGIDRLSFLTANPFDFTQDLVAVLALPKMDRYLHMAVQSGSDSVLQRMHRRHTAAEYKALVALIRQTVPDIEFGTDIIVGFPGETEQELTDTLKLLGQVRYNVVFTAMYSPRPGTSAEKMTDDVPKAVKKERYERVQELLARLQA